jgi:predicted dehydrogenase
MSKVRVGIVGSKFAADFHCDAYSRNRDVEIAAVAAIDNLQGISAKWRIPGTYDDYAEMFRREKLDLVSVCVPNFLHHDVVIAASNAGLNVVCEKPLATTVEDGREMVAVCERNRTKLFYAEDWCFSPALRRVDALVQEGGVGRVLYVKAKECHNGSHSPFARQVKTCGGGSFIHLGVHPVGYLLHLVGKGTNPVVEVCGRMTGGSEHNFVHKDFEGEDFGLGFMRFENGEFGFVEGNYITVGGMDDKVEVYGSDGVLKVDLTFGSNIDCYSRKGISYSIEKTDHNLGWTKPAVDEFYSLGYVAEMAYFVDCVVNNAEPEYGVSGRAGLTCLELIDSFYRSNRENRVVSGRWV